MTGTASPALRPPALRSGHPRPGPARLPCPAGDRSPGGGAFAAGPPAAGDCPALPQVASAYAAYLYARTGVMPGTSADAGQAHVSVRTHDGLLLLTFRCRGGHAQEWALSSAEIRCAGQVIAFGSGQLRRMVAALLGS
jgi:hypothetical protein